MLKSKLTKVIAITVIIQLILLTGCAKNKTATEHNATHQETTTTDNKNPSTYLAVTKNTSRILGNNAEAISLSTSYMIWPATETGNRPKIVIIAPSESWQIQLISTDLIHHPSDGPMLVTSKYKISDAVLSELSRLNPVGGSDGTKIITIGMSDTAAKQLADKGYKIHQINGDNFNKLAEDIDAYYGSIGGGLPNSVIISSSEQAEYSAPAGNWIAHMPEPLLYVTKDTVPAETQSALGKRNGKATIYLLGPESVISKSVETSLQKYGKVTRISGETPYSNSIAFAKFKDATTGFGWGITAPGHGLLISTKAQIKESIAASAFSHRGKHAPLLITDSDKAPQELLDYLKQLKPYFRTEPTEGPYTHLYITGDKDWISIEQQGNLDNLVEIESESGKGHDSENISTEGHGGMNSNKMSH